MYRFLSICLTLLSFSVVKARATTWDEPWADTVISRASSFVLATVDSSDATRGIYIRVIKTLAGKELRGSLVINGFYLLHLCSYSEGEEPAFMVSPIDSCYFFIYRNDKGQYCIATPTAGFDYCARGKVAGTYRHSYHKAAVPVDIYERTMTAIFNHYHQVPYDQAYVMRYVKQYLSQKPSPLNEEGAPLFFLQHVALECVYHLRLPVREDLIYPFLDDTSNFHNQVSAARALAACPTAGAESALLRVIEDSTRSGFVKVMCIWTLRDLHPGGLKSKVEALIPAASTEDNGFGGDIMDPRVCTSIPTVKEALEDLASRLD